MLYVVFLFCACLLQAQNIDTVYIVNGSFEDVPRHGGEDRKPISGWYDCGEKRFPSENPPDIHPGGYWENKVNAYHGKTYLGMVVRDNDTYEGVGQVLNGELERGRCYEFSVSLAQSPKYWSRSKLTNKNANYIRPTVLRVWGGNSLCEEIELLAESNPINHQNWNTYKFSFKPSQTFSHILVEAYYKTNSKVSYNGHILLDDLSHFYEVACY